MSRVLLVEDEPHIASFLAKGLRAGGHTVTTVDDGYSALGAAHDEDVDLLVLDLGLPDVDGLTVLAQLRRRGVAMPIIVLTARDGLRDRVGGLDGGADDYLTKPVAVEELLARIRVQLRGSAAPPPPPRVLRAGDVQVDLLSRRVLRDGREVTLSARELLLAETFLQHPGQTLSREQLLVRVWGYHVDPGSNVVDVYVGYLRRKLGAGLITTVRGIGYRCSG